MITRWELAPNFLWPWGVGWEVEHIDVKDWLEKFIICERENFSSVSALGLPMLTSIILYSSSVSKSSYLMTSPGGSYQLWFVIAASKGIGYTASSISQRQILSQQMARRQIVLIMATSKLRALGRFYHEASLSFWSNLSAATLALLNRTMCLIVMYRLDRGWVEWRMYDSGKEDEVPGWTKSDKTVEKSDGTVWKSE